MRKAIAFSSFAFLLAIPAFGQNTTAQKPSPTIQCRPLNGSSTPIQPDEQLIGDQICRSVQSVSAPQAEPATANVTAAAVKSDAAPATDKQTTPAEQTPATIYFYRPHRFQGAALKPSVFVDDARSGQLHNGDSIRISVAPGNHRIYSTDKSTGIELNTKPGETYYVRVDIQVGFWKGHGGVTLVDPQEGKYEAAQAAHQGADN